MHDLPRLVWLKGKTHTQGNGGRKNRSGYAEEHRDALVDNLIRDLEKATPIKPSEPITEGESTPVVI